MYVFVSFLQLNQLIVCTYNIKFKIITTCPPHNNSDDVDYELVCMCVFDLLNHFTSSECRILHFFLTHSFTLYLFFFFVFSIHQIIIFFHIFLRLFIKFNFIYILGTIRIDIVLAIKFT